MTTTLPESRWYVDAPLRLSNTANRQPVPAAPSSWFTYVGAPQSEPSGPGLETSNSAGWQPTDAGDDLPERTIHVRDKFIEATQVARGAGATAVQQILEGFDYYEAAVLSEGALPGSNRARKLEQLSGYTRKTMRTPEWIGQIIREYAIGLKRGPNAELVWREAQQRGQTLTMPQLALQEQRPRSVRVRSWLGRLAVWRQS